MIAAGIICCMKTFEAQRGFLEYTQLHFGTRDGNVVYGGLHEIGVDAEVVLMDMVAHPDTYGFHKDLVARLDRTEQPVFIERGVRYTPFGLDHAVRHAVNDGTHGAMMEVPLVRLLAGQKPLQK